MTQGASTAGNTLALVSDHDQMQSGTNPPEISGVAGHNGLPCPLRTNNDVGINDVGRRGSCEQQTNSRRMWSVERNKVRAGLSN
jgi:hypothetical protein